MFTSGASNAKTKYRKGSCTVSEVSKTRFWDSFEPLLPLARPLPLLPRLTKDLPYGSLQPVRAETHNREHILDAEWFWH